MKLKTFIAVILSGLMTTAFANDQAVVAQTADDSMPSAMQGQPAVVADNGSAMSSTMPNSSGSAMSGTMPNSSGSGMAGSANSTTDPATSGSATTGSANTSDGGNDQGSADTATGDDDY